MFDISSPSAGKGELVGVIIARPPVQSRRRRLPAVVKITGNVNTKAGQAVLNWKKPGQAKAEAGQFADVALKVAWCMLCTSYGRA